MRVKPILAAAAALAALALAVRQVTQAVHRTFTPPADRAQIAHASPRTQNGLTLLEVQNVSSDRSYSYTDNGPQNNGGSSNAAPEADTGLWIKMPPNFSLPPNCGGQSVDNGCDKLLSVMARSPTGQAFPLAWQTSSGSNPPGGQIYLLASIPAGYPNIMRWADVTVDDKRGDTATWRVTHLPPMQHVLAPPVTPQTIFHQNNIQAVVHAYGGSDQYNPSLLPGIHFDLKGTIAGAAHLWEIGHLTQTLEWEPPGFVPQEAGSTMGTSKVGSTVSLQMEGQQLFYNRSYPYLNDTHWVRLSAKLQEFETYDETVVFHHLSVFKRKNGALYLVGAGPQTVTTPSGVSVTLDDVQHTPNFLGGFGGNGYAIHLLYPQTALFSSLPRSPLWRTYKRPIKISADIPKPYSSMGSSYGNNEGTYMFRVSGYGLNGNGPLPKVIANFPVTIQQRVDLRSVPMTFTLPLEKR